MLGVMRGRRYMARHDFARALATVQNACNSESKHWLPKAYYRLGMYSTVASLPHDPTDRRHILPMVVSLAACGQYERVHKIVASVYWQKIPEKLRVALADALAPFMPALALRLLVPVRHVASPALYVGLLLRTGRVRRANLALETAIKAGEVKLYPELHLFKTIAVKDSPAIQLNRLNSFLSAYNLVPVTLRHWDESPSPCNVQVIEPLPATDGPLVSVLMTTFKTGHRASAAIESLLNQTYRNLEIIVIDDASQDETPDLVEMWARKDKRVRILRLDVNVGTYLAKNIGLLSARGEFVTCHDSDDWSHPLKIELQMRPLLHDKKLVATTSHWVRMQDDGVFYARPVHPLMRLNPSSPLFRRKLVLQRMGPWDCVRTGADSEFYARLRLVFGKQAVERVALPLSFGSHRRDSLMTAYATGYSNAGISSQRLKYWESWNAWHLSCLRAGKLPRLPNELSTLLKSRPFEAPDEINIDLGLLKDLVRFYERDFLK